MENSTHVTKILEIIYDTKISEGMTNDVIVVDASMNMSSLGEIFLSRRIYSIPVMFNMEIAGIITIRDYIKWLASGEEDRPILGGMSRKVKTVFEYSPFVEALKKFERYDHNCFPVINEDLRLVGILTKGDILRCILKKMEVGYEEEEIHTYRASHIFEDIVADRSTLKLHYAIQGKDFKRAGDCATSLKKTLNRLGIHSQVIRRVAIAVYEAEMNMVVFADEGEIVAEIEKNKIRITAKDRGSGIEDIEKAMRPGYSTAPDWVREMGFGAGMGLFNINKCSDTMKIESQVGIGTEVNIEIFLTNGCEP